MLKKRFQTYVRNTKKREAQRKQTIMNLHI